MVNTEQRTELYARYFVEPYASLITLDEHHHEMPTVVWVAPYAGKLLTWLPSASTSARRIRREPRCLLAVCDEDGVLLDDPIRAYARIMFRQERPAALQALYEKYGWKFRVLRATMALGRCLGIRPRGYVGVELTLA